MFKGNPRNSGSRGDDEPGRLSFEYTHLLLDQERMSRLRNAWQNPTVVSQTDESAREKLNDQWIVTHLSSDAMTGLRHEIEVLASLGMLSVKTNGKIVLAEEWETRIPHMVLNEMRGEWGEIDVDNLFCIHDKIKATLGSAWEHVEDDGWRMKSDEGEVLHDDEEYEMRKEIFVENYKTWVDENQGMGLFGV